MTRLTSISFCVLGAELDVVSLALHKDWKHGETASLALYKGQKHTHPQLTTAWCISFICTQAEKYKSNYLGFMGCNYFLTGNSLSIQTLLTVKQRWNRKFSLQQVWKIYTLIQEQNRTEALLDAKSCRRLENFIVCLFTQRPLMIVASTQQEAAKTVQHNVSAATGPSPLKLLVHFSVFILNRARLSVSTCFQCLC